MILLVVVFADMEKYLSSCTSLETESTLALISFKLLAFAVRISWSHLLLLLPVLSPFSEVVPSADELAQLTGHCAVQVESSALNDIENSLAKERLNRAKITTAAKYIF